MKQGIVDQTTGKVTSYMADIADENNTPYKVYFDINGDVTALYE